MLQVPPSPALLSGMSPLGSSEKVSLEGGKRSTRSTANPPPVFSSGLPIIPSSTRSHGPASSSGRSQQGKVQLPLGQPQGAGAQPPPNSTRSRATGAGTSAAGAVPASTRPSPSSASIISMFSGLSESHKSLLSKLLAQGAATSTAAIKGQATGRLTRSTSRRDQPGGGGGAPTPTLLGPAATSKAAPPPASTHGTRGGATALMLSPGFGRDYTDVLITPTIPNEEMDMLLEFLKGS